ncbi:ribosome maturation factor RimM [Psychrobium sp. 1_MG-2023]|uniref:ribosome maturation factor RimM n=1 Tax=Psychrobium sp. 1_MG-2023 TaxID=3062624 RepID=UPI000C327E19|nr:ribosome maturation factor RimM [Psychrobium sp. 1_MG-2023]MDP2562690.1 ribosome maturation factor RimM [Psychrobium sp. 1_MG-2023]PKF54797.1 ribosome maturation factor RimM [Alteromonadales bacterium alter-6D02]
MSNQTDKVLLGCVGAPYGIKGWMKITTYTDLPESIFDYSSWLVESKGQWAEMKVAEWRRHGKGVVARFADVDDRDDAVRLTGCKIAVKPEQLAELDENDFYWRELIGMEVKNIKGYHFGHVDGLMETGSNDVLQVKANARDGFGKKERLIPLVDGQVIININRETRVIEVDWDPDF